MYGGARGRADLRVSGSHRSSQASMAQECSWFPRVDPFCPPRAYQVPYARPNRAYEPILTDKDVT
jgi:hypothetical protein